MHYYTFHPAKHRLETYHLEPLERLAYRELMDIYYDSERPLTTNVDDVAWRLGYKTDELKQALQVVLDRFFVIKKLKGDDEPMYHHVRMDSEIKAYKNAKGTNKTTNRVQTPTNDGTNATNEIINDGTNKSTKKNSTDAQKEILIKAIRNQGVKANTRMTIGQLQMLFDTHCKQPTNDGTNETTNPTKATNETTNPILEGKTINNKQVTINKEQNNISPQTPQGACVGVGENEISDETTHQTNSANAETKPATSETPPSLSQSTTTKSKPNTSKQTAVQVQAWFDEFYKAYPLKKSKGQAQTTFAKIMKNSQNPEILFGQIMAGLTKNMGHLQNQLDRGYCQYPSTWLNAQGWLDETPQQAKPSDKFYGTPADPLAVNQKHFPTPPNWEENLAKAMAMGSNPIGLTEI
ncbi:MAG: YdaU family protein [Moraxella sp.]|nr:YdaU family protein [Moraxella sp.]